MSQYCANDPIQRIVNNRKVTLLDPQQRRVYKHRGGSNNIHDRPSNVQTVETKFLSINSPANNRATRITNSALTSGVVKSKGRENDDWISEFSSMKVRDPLEFSDTYKSLYKQYETRSQSGSSHINVGVGNLRNVRSMPYISRHLHENTTEKSRDDPKIADMAFEHEFELIDQEQQLEEIEENISKEQLEFQESAQNFVKVCEQSESNNSLKRSKFFQLMQKVSDGKASVKYTDNSNYVIE
ncbi:Peroxisomal protein PEX21 [Nakaseomyces bracarensis]|uniref:Peroxisomal protein PEX21 n=1 Tax=Nakaseomyces bracarensis TaxID=273131 RepID=A0ABR4NR53_9SACH